MTQAETQPASGDLEARETVARAIADGFSNGCEQYDEATEAQRDRYDMAADGVLAALSRPTPGQGEVTDEWAERFCEAVNWNPDGQECKTVEGEIRCVTFRQLAKGYILSAIATDPCAAPTTQGQAADPRLTEWGYASTDEALTHLGKLLDDQAAFDGLGQAAPVAGEAVAWRVKDWADGWIIYHCEQRARSESATMGGATIQPLYTHPPAPEPAAARGGEEDGLDLYDPIAQEAISWTLRQVGEAVGLKTWDGGDGSETVEGDVAQEIMTILTDAGLYDPEDGRFAELAAAPAPAAEGES